MWSELNGSIASPLTIQPSLGEGTGGTACELGVPKSSHGAAEMSCVYRSDRLGKLVKSQIRVHVVPPSVLRQSIVSGHHEFSAVTMIVFGCCASTERPLYPK